MSEDQAPVEEVVSDAPPVTSVVEVQGVVTIRRYDDGTVQKNVWDSPELAQEYADSVKEQEG